MDRDKWPDLNGAQGNKSSDKVVEETIFSLDPEKETEIEGLTQEESLMDLASIHSGEEESDESCQHPWVASGSKKKRRQQQKKKVFMATRTSARVPKDGRTMMEKAIQRAEANDISTKGKTSANQFLVLNNLDNEHIHNVVSELDLDIENIDTQIDIFKAEERVRAALAEANYKEYLEKANRKTAPQGEEGLSELNLSIIDNSTRGVELQHADKMKKLPPKGRGRPKKKLK
jgi:hypothetical protein